MTVRLTYSIADQNFERTKSLGILRLSVLMLNELATRPEVASLAVLANSSLAPRLKLPPGATVQLRDSVMDGGWRRMWWDQHGVYKAAKALRNDWLVLPKGFASGLSPCPAKLVTYVHDAMADHYKQHYPQATSWLENWYFRWSLRCSIRYSTLIITNSDFTTAEIAKIARESGIKAPPIYTVGVGLDARNVGEGKRDGILALASPLPHKRTDLALEYMERWQAQTGFAGPVHWVGRLPEGLTPREFPNWKFHPRIQNDVYYQLMRDSRAMLYFTAHEGFGLPPAEGVQTGSCPVYSDLPASREVMAGMGCAFANEDFNSFAAALNEALLVPQETLKTWSDALMSRHNWASVVDKTLEAMAAVDAATPVKGQKNN